MTRSGKPLPRDVVANWPEIFGEVELNVIPLEYLKSVMVNFKDGKVWEIKITEEARQQGWEKFEKTLLDLCRHYDSSIKDLDFKIDTASIKIHAQTTTSKFLKKKKL